MSKGPDYVLVPQTVDTTEQQATTQLESMGLNVETKQGYSNTVTAGNVMASSPNSGEQLIKGQTVTLTVSNGPPVFAVPSVDGQNIDDAMRVIRNAGFVPHAVQFAPGGPNLVFREKPHNELVPHGTVITLNYW
jgi:eukaryotic-like serine/threonine-protein kinase